MTDRERSLLLDAAAMLDHYARGRRDNWDGSTKQQALLLIIEINQLLREDKEKSA